ncbi:hypothetical protein K7432_001464 [Basidiobolus ranarum]|uniref:RPA-interacting protein C-terminal domain-containing protein n=1 Tax=Basidiobolus ranarum TaxID=34480 RepID=A0ABR2W9M1_9FUNG
MNVIDPFNFNRSATHSSRRNSPRASPKTRRVWRDEFKRQCLDRIKESRWAEQNRKRLFHSNESAFGDSPMEEEKWLQRLISEEWSKFQQEKNLAHANEVIELSEEMATALEEEIVRESTDDYEALCAFEDAILSADMEKYEEIQMNQMESPEHVETCVICNQGTLLQESATSLKCNNCHFQVDYQSWQNIHNLKLAHRSTCPGNSLFTFNASTGLIMLCDRCDWCEAVV